MSKRFFLAIALLAPAVAFADNGSAPSVTVGESVNGSCTSGYNLFNNGGVVGCQANGAGGGGSTLTAGTSATSGFLASQLLYSNGSVLEAGAVGAGLSMSSGTLSLGDSGLTYSTGKLTVGTTTAGATNYLAIANSTSGSNNRYVVLGNGNWWSNAVPYLQPLSDNTGIALDILPKGSTAQTTWVDICSTDVTLSSANWECLDLKKLAGGASLVQSTAAGTGTVRPLLMQTTGGGVGIGLGNTSTPAGLLDVAGSLAIGSYAGGGAAPPSNGAIISGEVGINTPTPLSGLNLDVNGIVGAGYLNGSGEYRAWGTAQSANNYVSLKAQSGSPYSYGLYAGSPADFMLYYNGGNGNLVLNSPNSGGLPIQFEIHDTEYARLTTTGLGLGGNTSPAYPLDVTGAANATSYRVGGTAGASGTGCITVTVSGGIATGCGTSYASQAANTVLGNGAGSSAAPTALTMPSCSGSTNALIWTSGTGFGCNTLPGSSFTFTGGITNSSGTVSLSTIAANSLLGNATGSTAGPVAVSMPSCGGATQALSWTAGTGFGCNTIAGSSLTFSTGLTNSSGTITLGDSGLTYSAGSMTLAAGTITSSTPGLYVTQTWNSSSTTFDAPLKINVTNTASASGSLLVDYQVGGSSKYNINASGQVSFSPGSSAAPTLTGGVSNSGLFFAGSQYDIEYTRAGSPMAYIGYQKIAQTSSGLFGWASSTDPSATPDTALKRVSSGVVLVSNNSTGAGVVQHQAVTYSTLTTQVTSPAAGMIAAITDATSCTKGGSITGGGSTYCVITYNGSSWQGI